MSKIKSIIALSVASVLLLAGCASNSNPATNAYDGLSPTCERFKGGPQIDEVKVTAAEGTVPTVVFPTKADGTSELASIKTSQTKVVKEGSGPEFTGNQLVTIEYLVINSSTGAVLAGSKFDGTDAASQVFDSTSTKIFCDDLTGVREGSLVAFANPKSPQDTNGTLYVLLLKKVFLPHANGEVQGLPSGLPSVIRTPKTGQPALVRPNFSAPKDLQKAVLIKGRGDAVKAGDSVTVHYVGWVWGSEFGTAFDSSWDSGRGPATFTLKTGNGGLIKGFVEGIEGETVGSQVIVSMPPADGYGPEGNGSTIPANATLVFVIDILGINK
ncbi:MAG: FKBP-type peptidyl-prolyl cis-trans isomerase [Rhodoluna sp.]|nr:FKBP-type peptidyl-prolyl cis-trans isomerase [Rhodoluna sp.]